MYTLGDVIVPNKFSQDTQKNERTYTKKINFQNKFFRAIQLRKEAKLAINLVTNCFVCDEDFHH